MAELRRLIVAVLNECDYEKREEIFDEQLGILDTIILARMEKREDDMLSRIRSEEHTSELQSLMRISYAVFCLTKKNNKHNNYHILAYTQTTTSNNIHSY